MPEHIGGEDSEGKEHQAIDLATFDLLLQQLRDCYVRQVQHPSRPPPRAHPAAQRSKGPLLVAAHEENAKTLQQLQEEVGKEEEASQEGISQTDSESDSPLGGWQALAARFRTDEPELVARPGVAPRGITPPDPTSSKHSSASPCSQPSRLTLSFASSSSQPSAPKDWKGRFWARFWRVFVCCTNENASGHEFGLFRHALMSIGSISSTPSLKTSGQWLSHCCHLPSGFRRLERIVTTPAFEIVFGSLIVLNMLVFAMDIQVTGWDRGVEDALLTNSSTHKHGDVEPWLSLMRAADIIEIVIGCAFVVEVASKLLALGVRRFAKDPWNWVDAVVVVAWLVDMVTRLLRIGGALGLRALRVLRAFRVLRLLKTVGVFDSLFLLNAALRGCAAVLFWSLLYLILVQLTLALAMSQYVNDFYLTDHSIPHADREEVYQYFGTFSYATLTMFEMTLANWPPVCRVMMHRLSEWWVVFALLHKLTIGFAIVGIINGAVMQETFKAASWDQDVMVRDKKKQAEAIRRSLKLVFESADRRRSGCLDIGQFSKVCSHPVVKLWLTSIGLNTADAEKVFKIIDDGDGLLTAEEFLNGMERLRGVASSVDMHVIMRELLGKLKENRKSQSQSLEALGMQIREQEGALKDLVRAIQHATIAGHGLLPPAPEDQAPPPKGEAMVSSEPAPTTSDSLESLPAPPASARVPWHSKQLL